MLKMILRAKFHTRTQLSLVLRMRCTRESGFGFKLKKKKIHTQTSQISVDVRAGSRFWQLLDQCSFRVNVLPHEALIPSRVSNLSVVFVYFQLQAIDPCFGIMLLGQADLCKKASKLELKEWKERKFHPAFLLELEALLLDVYASLLPTASEYEQRKQLVHAYDMIAKSIFGNTGGFPVVEAFGSFVMNIYTAESDLDLSINFNNSNVTRFPRDQVVSVLRRFAKVLYKKQRKGHLSGVLPILQARVPVLKAVDCRTGIECDISVENKDGISRSLFFSIISSIDERFRIMSYLMKAWAKANDINSSKDRTINSLSIISLVAFHFQTRDPPILPPFSTLLRDGTDITNLPNVVLTLKNFGRRNKESVAELFVALLAKLSSVENLWELGLCASIFEGSWISKTWGSKVANMSVEDFLDRSQNFARSVGKVEMPKIYDCLRGSLEHLSHSMQGQIELSALRSFLFGSFSFNVQMDCINKTSMIVNKKLPIQSVQPIVDKSNPANRRKQAYSESSQAHVDAITTTNLANNNMAMTRKRKLPSNVPVDPLVNTIIPINHPSNNLAKNLEQNLPGIESREPHITMITPKRPHYVNAAGASSFGFHQNQCTTYLPIPIVYPALPPPQPINGVGHPLISFDSSGYISQSNPKQPIYANTGHGQHHNHLIYASQYHPTAPVHLAYGSQRPQYYPNPVHPIFHLHAIHDTGHPQHLAPPRWLGPNHL